MHCISHEKLHKTAGNNRGFTLIELIISIAILAVVMVAALGFMGTGANLYTRNSIQIGLQNASEQALTQMDQKSSTRTPALSGNRRRTTRRPPTSSS